MIDDAFKLTIDVIFPPIFTQKNYSTENYSYPVPKYDDNENMW